MKRKIMSSSSSPSSLVMVLLLCSAQLLCGASSTTLHNNLPSTTITASSPFYFDQTSQYPTPSLIDDGVLTFFSKKWSHAKYIALLEQAVEDHNAEYVATSANGIDAISYRRAIALPLDDRFDPPVGVFSHGHIYTG